MTEDHPIVRLAEKIEPTFRRRIVQAIEQIQAQIDLSRVMDAIRSGHMVATGDAAQVPALSHLGEAVEPLIKQAFLNGAQHALAGLPQAPKKDVGVSLSHANPAAVAYARLQAAELVTVTQENAKELIRILISEGLARGESPFVIARRIRAVVGLTIPQGEAVEHFYERLQPLLDDEKITLEQALARTDRYAVAKLRERADMIARTETTTALNTGQQAIWEQAETHGELNYDVTWRQWITTPDERICPICEPMDGEEARLDEPFVLIDSDEAGREVMIPGMDTHINCRCTFGLTFRRSDHAAD